MAVYIKYEVIGNSIIEVIALNKAQRKDHLTYTSDAYFRNRFKNAVAHLEPPANGRKRLLSAAYAEAQPSSNRFDHLLELIETEQYTHIQYLVPWAASARFHTSILSVIKMK